MTRQPIASSNLADCAAAPADWRVFIASVQHELRTPANSIEGFARCLQEGMPADGEFAEDVRCILWSGEELTRLIDKFLNLATTLGDADEVDLIGEISQFRHSAAGHLQVIDGLVELNTSVPDVEKGRQPAADLQRIARSSRRVREVIDELPRALRAGSAPRYADAVIVEQAVSSLKSMSDTTRFHSARGTVMVVDDDEFNQELMGRQLEVLGYQVVSARDGIHALALLSRRAVDAVLLDIIMPRMNGYQTLRAIREDSELRDIPVIMVSALDDMDSVSRCLELGADDYLPKRFNPALLRARLRGCLEKKRLRDRERAHQRVVDDERAKSDRLLLNILPASIAERLKAEEQEIVDAFDDVSVLFADLCGFTAFSSQHSAAKVLSALNTIFGHIDEIVTRHGLEKIKTIGDAYMLAGGLTQTADGDHLATVVAAGEEIIAAVAAFQRREGLGLDIRVGIDVGPVVAGVIGKVKFAYDLWGDTVNIASRMESAGVPGRVHVSQRVYERLCGTLAFEHREPLAIKGKGLMQTYLLDPSGGPQA
jgi:class 3 adenylate cyclase